MVQTCESSRYSRCLQPMPGGHARTDLGWWCFVHHGGPDSKAGRAWTKCLARMKIVVFTRIRPVSTSNSVYKKNHSWKFAVFLPHLAPGFKKMPCADHSFRLKRAAHGTALTLTRRLLGCLASWCRWALRSSCLIPAPWAAPNRRPSWRPCPPGVVAETRDGQLMLWQKRWSTWATWQSLWSLNLRCTAPLEQRVSRSEWAQAWLALRPVLILTACLRAPWMFGLLLCEIDTVRSHLTIQVADQICLFIM